MNYRTTSATLLALVATIGISMAGTDKPDFSGNWVLDKAKSEGLPNGMDQSMVVKQEGERIEVEVKVSTPQADRTVNDTYVLNGEPTDFTPPIMIGAGTSEKGKRIAKWSADANGFESTEEATIDGPEGEEKITGERRWRLSADKKTLTIDMVLGGSQGPAKSTRVFTRK